MHSINVNHSEIESISIENKMRTMEFFLLSHPEKKRNFLFHFCAISARDWIGMVVKIFFITKKIFHLHSLININFFTLFYQHEIEKKINEKNSILTTRHGGERRKV
jgi:hypothetical protein